MAPLLLFIFVSPKKARRGKQGSVIGGKDIGTCKFANTFAHGCNWVL